MFRAYSVHVQSMHGSTLFCGSLVLCKELSSVDVGADNFLVVNVDENRMISHCPAAFINNSMRLAICRSTYISVK